MLDIIPFLLVITQVLYTSIWSSWTTFILSIVVLYFLYVILPSFFGLEYMNGLDAAWYSEIPTNLRYNQGALIVDRMTRYEVRSMLSDRGIGTHAKFQNCSVRILGRQFWKKEESYSVEKHLCIYEKPLHNLDELYAFKEELFIKEIPQELAQWELHFVEKYEDDKSVLIFKSHHGLCDGLALISLIVASSDPREVKEHYVRFNRKPFLVQLGYYIKSIVTFPYFAFILLRRNDPVTPIHGRPLSGKKSVALSADIPISQLKSLCLKHGIAINTCILSIISGGVQKYLASQNCYVKELNAIMPFSMRMLPEDNSALPLINDISFLVSTVPLNITDETKRFKIFHELCEGLKYSTEPFASIMAQKLAGTILPYTLRSHFANDFGSRSSFSFTNVPGPKSLITYHGKKTHKIFFAAPSSGNNALSISSFSYNGNLTIGVTCDKGIIPDAKDLIKFIEKELEVIN